MLIWLSVRSLTYYPFFDVRQALCFWMIYSLSAQHSQCMCNSEIPAYLLNGRSMFERPVSHKLAEITRAAHCVRPGIRLSGNWEQIGCRVRLVFFVVFFYMEESKLMAILWVSRIRLRPMQEQHEEFRIINTPRKQICFLPTARPAETANWILIETVTVAAVSGVFREIELRERCFTAVGRESCLCCRSRC